jgi:hypothetical protein
MHAIEGDVVGFLGEAGSIGIAVATRPSIVQTS